MNLTRKTLTWFLRGIVCFLLSLLVFMGAVYIFLQRDPDAFANKYLAEISRTTGLKFSFGAIDVSLLPFPAVSVSDLHVTGHGLDFKAAWITASPDWLPLLRGKISPGRLTVLRPRLFARTSLPLRDPVALARSISAAKDSDSGKREGYSLDFSSLVAGSCMVEVMQMEGMIQGADNSFLALHSLQCALEVDKSLSVEGDLRLAALRMGADRENVFNLENFYVSGDASPANFFLATPGLKASGHVRYKNVISTGSFSLDFESSTINCNGSFDLRADLELAGDIVPAMVSGRAMEIEKGKKIVFRGVEWSFGNDSGALDATLEIPANAADFLLSGTFMGRRLSLTEWLGFTRNLPPGLQISMDNIFDARLDFQLTAKGLQVPRIVANCAGSRFSGKGSVASFAKPVVALDMRARSVNLRAGLPEAVGITPTAPYYAHGPLTPISASPLKEGESGIGYDIRLASDLINYGPLKIRNGSLRIHPGKMDKNGLEDVLLTGKGSFYGGTLSGECILGVHASVPYNISGTAKNVNGALLARDLPALPFTSGTFRLGANISSKSKKLDVFLANMRGWVEVAGEKAGLKSAGQTFSSLSAKSEIKGATLAKNRLGVDGQWRAAGKTGEIDSDIQLDGKLWFGGTDGGMTFSGLPGVINFTLAESLGNAPAGSKGKLRGVMGASSGDGKFSIRDGRYEFMGISGKIGASVDVDKGEPEWKGEFSANTPDLDKTVALFTGRRDSVPAAFRKFSASAAFSGTPDILRLSAIKAGSGASSISGRLSLQKKGGKPHIDFALDMDTLDLGQFSEAGKTGNQKVKKWDFSALRAFSAKGELKARLLKGWKVNIGNARLPLKLEGGEMEIGPGTGRLYGAPLHFRVNMDFRRGVAFNGTMSAHGFDLGAAAKAQEIKSDLTGTVNLDTSMRAAVSGPGQMAGALNGQWSFSIRDGSWQARSKNGKLEGKPTRFRLASASGTIASGLVKSGNIAVRASDMDVTGHGSLNLVTEKIDCDFNVNMKGLPDIPLRLYGNLGEPKTSIGAGKMVVNAITGITRGVVDVLGGIVEGAWKILR